MYFEILHLKDLYPVLDRNGADPTLEVMVQDTVIESKPKRPSMLICPGGGYGFTSPREAQNIGFEFMTMGLNAFVLHYSIKPHTYPQQIIEVACAMDYIISNAERFNCDAEKTAIIGFSAGGHLVASYCTMRNRPEITEMIPEPKPVQAAILSYPVITAETPTHFGSFYNLLGKTDLNEDDIERFSAEKHVSKELTPPTFIWTTAEDTTVDPINSLKYASALSSNKIPFELHVFPNGGHGLSTAKFGTVNMPKLPVCDYTSVWVDYAKKWLRLVFDI